jgi:hypothetical protein
MSSADKFCFGGIESTGEDGMDSYAPNCMTRRVDNLLVASI